jgi:hypothetical protein
MIKIEKNKIIFYFYYLIKCITFKMTSSISVSDSSNNLISDLNNIINSYTDEKSHLESVDSKNSKTKAQIIAEDLPDVDTEMLLRLQYATSLSMKYRYCKYINNRNYNNINSKRLAGIFFILLNRYTYDEILNAAVTNISCVSNLEGEGSSGCLADVIKDLEILLSDLCSMPTINENDFTENDTNKTVEKELAGKISESTINRILAYINNSLSDYNYLMTLAYENLTRSISVENFDPWYKHKELMEVEILKILDRKESQRKINESENELNNKLDELKLKN